MSTFGTAKDREASYKPERLSNWASKQSLRPETVQLWKSAPPKRVGHPIVDANGHLLVRKKPGRTAFNLNDETSGAFCSNMRWPQENTMINAKGGVIIKAASSAHQECHGG